MSDDKKPTKNALFVAGEYIPLLPTEVLVAAVNVADCNFFKREGEEIKILVSPAQLVQIGAFIQGAAIFDYIKHIAEKEKANSTVH